MPVTRYRQARYTMRGRVPQDVIEAVDFSPPALQPGQVLLEVLAAPVNPSDVMTLTGEYGSLPPLPAIGGNEGVGRVVDVGAEVTALKLGQTVLLPIGCGSWSTHVVADARTLMSLPDNADPLQLAMLTVNPPTASLLLSDVVDLEPRGWVIQNAANSAVGGYLAQLARSRGLRTINVVRREGARAAVEASGGDIVLIDGDDLADRVREATTGAAIALAIDAVGGGATERLARCLAPGGTLVNYGAMSGEPCAISPGSLIFRDVTLRGFWLARWYKTAAAARREAVFAELTGLIAKGELTARVSATFGVDRIKDAVAAAATGERDGKILIVPQQH